MKEILTFKDLQDHVWLSLPYVRRHLVGRQKINDLVDIVMIEWPETSLSCSSSDDTAERQSMRTLHQSVNRQITLLYGDTKYGFATSVIVLMVLWYVLWIVLAWWRLSRKNQHLMSEWRTSYRI